MKNNSFFSKYSIVFTEKKTVSLQYQYTLLSAVLQLSRQTPEGLDNIFGIPDLIFQEYLQSFLKETLANIPKLYLRNVCK